MTTSIALKTLLAVALLSTTGIAAAQESAPAPATPAPAASPSLASQNGLFVFPAKGQDATQQATDESQCYDWTKTQTGYDPKSPPPAQAATPAETDDGPKGERIKGAARGAAAGAVIGEVANDDASEGAEVGAAAGVVAGGHRTRKDRRDQRDKAEEQAKADTQAAETAQVDTFKRGFSGCLESRGYTVK
jgi:YMGG-like Gly-zipper